MNIFLLLACTQDELSQNWQLYRTRILGAQADPPEAQPGQTVLFRSLVFSPESIESVVWFACLPDSATSFGCTIDPALLGGLQEGEEPDINSLIEAGFAGAEPMFPASWTVPEDALDGLTEAQKNDGLSAFVTISAIPQDATEDSDFEVAYKRFPVSTSETPNNNPVIDNISIDTIPYQSDEIFTAIAGETYTLTPNFEERHVETYAFLNREGEFEDRIEEPYFSWFTEGGAFYQPISLYPNTGVEWTAPPTPFSGQIITVMRDRRGGMAWAWIQVEVQL